MKTLVINGSPRPNGDTVSLLRRLEEGLAGEYKAVDAYRRHISPCVDCRYCRERSGCAIQDEMQEIYPYLEACDNIVIASPIYFSEVTGKVLDVCSRLQTYFCARFYRGEIPVARAKRGAVILVGGGGGAPDKAYGTACTLLRQMNCHDVHPLVCSHGTDRLPAARDGNALAGVESVVSFLNREK